MLLRMNLPTCGQSFETLHLFWYTSVYDNFKNFYFKFVFKLLRIFITENLYYIWGKIYTVSNTKFALDCTRFIFLVTCKQNLLPAGQGLMARPKQ